MISDVYAFRSDDCCSFGGLIQLFLPGDDHIQQLRRYIHERMIREGYSPCTDHPGKQRLSNFPPGIVFTISKVR